MRTLTYTFLFFFSIASLNAQNCLNIAKYEEKMLAVDNCIAAGNYSLAYDNGIWPSEVQKNLPVIHSLDGSPLPKK